MPGFSCPLEVAPNSEQTASQLAAASLWRKGWTCPGKTSFGLSYFTGALSITCLGMFMASQQPDMCFLQLQAPCPFITWLQACTQPSEPVDLSPGTVQCAQKSSCTAQSGYLIPCLPAHTLRDACARTLQIWVESHGLYLLLESAYPVMQCVLACRMLCKFAVQTMVPLLGRSSMGQEEQASSQTRPMKSKPRQSKRSFGG